MNGEKSVKLGRRKIIEIKNGIDRRIIVKETFENDWINIVIRRKFKYVFVFESIFLLTKVKQNKIKISKIKNPSAPVFSIVGAWPNKVEKI